MKSPREDIAFKISGVRIFQQPGASKLYFDQGFFWCWYVSLGLLLSLALSWLTTPCPAVIDHLAATSSPPSPSPPPLPTSSSSSSFGLTEIV